MTNRWINSENSDRLYFWGSKITADGDCSHEIKRRLLYGRGQGWGGNYDKTTQCIKKQRHYFANKLYVVKATVFPVVMYTCESWTIKNLSTEELMLFKNYYYFITFFTLQYCIGFAIH